MQETGFELGQTVRLRADTTREGAIVASLPSIGHEARYRVFHGPREIRDYFATQLVAVPVTAETSTLNALFDIDASVDAGQFLARLTAARLSHPQVDAIYSLYAARVQHIPFQFKPLLRLLRADRPRILIADEVGVGKTIETGLILKELQMRRRLDTILIVCPKSLATKWRAEMRRFDEEFMILGSVELRYCLREAHLDGAWPAHYGRAIVNLEAIRNEEYLRGANGRVRRPGMLELDPAPQFDFLIVDEAHHIRNPETNSYEIVRYLSEQSEAAVFLSATPVHVGARNLHTLLNLLRPDLFPDQSVFASMVEPNAHLTRAMRHVRTRRPTDTWRSDAAEALDDAANTDWGRKALVDDPRLLLWRQRLRGDGHLNETDRVRCIRDLEEIHTLAHVMNRTRRRDIGRFTIREPHTVSVPFTPAWQLFYDVLLDFRREVLSMDYDPRVVRLISDTLERQAASCLPSLVPMLDRFLQTGRFASSELTDVLDDDEIVADLPPHLVDQARTLRKMARNLPPHDPKRDRLLEVVEASMEPCEPGKVLVFSFFLHTLDYLNEALKNAGFRVAIISGQVPDDERERLRDRFRLDRKALDSLDVLLSSEVGCEGLDYEFCSCLVNYDIPWNPMRIEQRIGRIDRFGQLAEKVKIFNFITPGTVEERIFFRCFERLGVFHDTVGDLEEVLGDLVPDLTRIALDPSLSVEQAEQRALQMADNAVRLSGRGAATRRGEW